MTIYASPGLNELMQVQMVLQIPLINNELLPPGSEAIV